MKYITAIILIAVAIGGCGVASTPAGDTGLSSSEQNALSFIICCTALV